MKVTPAFIVASVLCAAPFALAVHADLTKKHSSYDDPFAEEHEWDSDDSDRYGGGYDDDLDIDREQLEEQLRKLREEQEAEMAAQSNRIKPGDLTELLGGEPATMGPVLSGLRLGASAMDFQPEESRSRIESYKEDHDVNVDFDFDDVSLNAVILQVQGEEEELRQALVDRWGTPRRGSEDELVWLGADKTRAVYASRYDGFELRFEPYMTVDELVAPGDKTKLGFEPFPIVGASFAKVEAAIGARFQASSDYEGSGSFALPGVGAGAGKTMVMVGSDDNGKKIVSMQIENGSYDGAEVKDALVKKWGAPKENDEGAYEWRKNGVTITAEFHDTSGFYIIVRK